MARFSRRAVSRWDGHSAFMSNEKTDCITIHTSRDFILSVFWIAYVIGLVFAVGWGFYALNIGSVNFVIV